MILFFPPEGESTESSWRILSPDERVRAASFIYSKHATHWIACRSFLRQVLGKVIHVPPAEVPLVISAEGKPELAEPFDYLRFSLSHCERLALVALSVDGPVGVDIEPFERGAELPGCESTFCHPEEIVGLPADPEARGRRLLELWTCKEALLKALGTGFLHPPESIRIHNSGALSDVSFPGIDGQHLQRLEHPALAGHCATVSGPMAADHIEIHPFETSTSGAPSGITARSSGKPNG
jgi:4'-phosphopantetheinyl transferase